MTKRTNNALAFDLQQQIVENIDNTLNKANFDETLNARLRNRMCPFQLVHDLIETINEANLDPDTIEDLRIELYHMNDNLQKAIDFFVKAETVEDLMKLDE